MRSKLLTLQATEVPINDDSDIIHSHYSQAYRLNIASGAHTSKLKQTRKSPGFRSRISR